MGLSIISTNGTLIPPGFDLAGPFTTEGAIACIADQCGLLDKNSSFITPTWNRQSGPFSENYSEGLASANKDGQWGYVDRARSVVIPFQFKYAGKFDQGMANLIPPKYDDVYPFSDGLAPVELAGKWGYVDRAGDVVVPIQYDIGHMFSERFASVELDGKWG